MRWNATRLPQSCWHAIPKDSWSNTVLQYCKREVLTSFSTKTNSGSWHLLCLYCAVNRNRSNFNMVPAFGSIAFQDPYCAKHIAPQSRQRRVKHRWACVLQQSMSNLENPFCNAAHTRHQAFLSCENNVSPR